MIRYRDFINETIMSSMELHENSFSFSEVFDKKWMELTDEIVKEMQILIGNLLWFRISSENGKFKNAKIRMRNIKSVISSGDANDHNIIFIDDNDNKYEIFNSKGSHYYYDVEPHLEKFKNSFKNKRIQFKKPRKFQTDVTQQALVDDIFITENEENNDVFAIRDISGEIILLPTFYNIKSMEQIYSDLDPYGEEDW